MHPIDFDGFASGRPAQKDSESNSIIPATLKFSSSTSSAAHHHHLSIPPESFPSHPRETYPSADAAAAVADGRGPIDAASQRRIG